jgi:hypothetical protein
LNALPSGGSRGFFFQRSMDTAMVPARAQLPGWCVPAVFRPLAPPHQSTGWPAPNIHHAHITAVSVQQLLLSQLR